MLFNFIGSEIESCIDKIQNDAVKLQFSGVLDKVRSDPLLLSWSKQVKARDRMRCTSCGSTDRLHSHHIKPKSTFPELKYDLDNGISLCALCHSDVHNGNTGLRNSIF